MRLYNTRTCLKHLHVRKVLFLCLCAYLVLVFEILEHQFEDGRQGEVIDSLDRVDRDKDQSLDLTSVYGYGPDEILQLNNDKRRKAIKNLQGERLVNQTRDRQFLKKFQNHQPRNQSDNLEVAVHLKNYQFAKKEKKHHKQLNRNAVGFNDENGEHKKPDTDRNMQKRPDNCRLYPDIILIGFEKCGTMTLRSYFGTHPEIFITHVTSNIPYFDPVVRMSFESYTRSMPCTPTDKLKLEKISCEGSAKKVFETLPNVKLLAIVREPVERAMSHYLHQSGRRGEKPNRFDAIIKTLLDGRTTGDEAIKSSGPFIYSKYIDLLKPWLETFGRDKIHVVDGDNFVNHPAVEFNKIERFLNISHYFTEDHFVYNAEKKFYCLNMLKETRCMDRSKGRPHPDMTDTTRKRLQTYFKPYNEKLFHAIGQRFSWNY